MRCVVKKLMCEHKECNNPALYSIYNENGLIWGFKSLEVCEKHLKYLKKEH